jgi:hypothetical protein
VPLRCLVVALLAAVVLAACGGDEDGTTTSAPTTKTDDSGQGGNGFRDGPESRDQLVAEVCDEAGCSGPTYQRGGQVYLCRQLEIVEETVPGPTGEATVPADTVTTTTVERPRCVGGSLPVEGLDLDELAGVQSSEDGGAAWTTEPVFIEGEVEDGTLQAAG